VKREATSTAVVAEAIHTGKLLLKWNPGDNQGMRTLLCNWMLEAGDTEGCSQLLRSFGGFRECSLAYTNECSLAYTGVLLRFQSSGWTRGDVAEEDVRTELSVALRSNVFVPGWLLEDQVARVKFESLDSGGPRGGELCSRCAFDLEAVPSGARMGEHAEGSGRHHPRGK
jgi:hypothetical protein